MALGFLLVVILLFSHQPGLVRRVAINTAHLYYTLHDPAPESLATSTGPNSEPNLVLRPDQLLSALSAMFPKQRVRIEYARQTDVASIADFKHQGESTLFRQHWPGPLPQGAHQQPWLWANTLRESIPSGSYREEWFDSPIDYLRETAGRAGIDPTLRARLFVAACLSEGITGRVVQLSGQGKSWDRTMAEIFLPDRDQWVLVDPELNLLFERQGVLLSAANLQSAWMNLKQRLGWKGIVSPTELARVQPAQVRAMVDVQLKPIGQAGHEQRSAALAQSPTGLLIEDFEYVVFPARNNFITHRYPPIHPADTTRLGLWADPSSPRRPIVCPELDVRYYHELYPSIGGTRIDIERVVPFLDQRTLSVRLSTYTPNFDHFQVRSHRGAWTDIVGTQVEWSLDRPLRPSTGMPVHEFEARSVNRSGVVGPAARVRIVVEPIPDRIGRL
jgi:hypothetical protein